MLTINEIVGHFDIEHILKVMEASMKIKNANKLLNEGKYKNTLMMKIICKNVI